MSNFKASLTRTAKSLVCQSYRPGSSRKRLHIVIGGMQYNFFIHSLPRGRQYEGLELSYHWHMEIIPRTNVPTGFELSSGLYTIGISPEQAAERLRSVNF